MRFEIGRFGAGAAGMGVAVRVGGVSRTETREKETRRRKKKSESRRQRSDAILKDNNKEKRNRVLTFKEKKVIGHVSNSKGGGWQWAILGGRQLGGMGSGRERGRSSLPCRVQIPPDPS